MTSVMTFACQSDTTKLLQVTLQAQFQIPLRIYFYLLLSISSQRLNLRV